MATFEMNHDLLVAAMRRAAGVQVFGVETVFLVYAGLAMWLVRGNGYCFIAIASVVLAVLVGVRIHRHKRLRHLLRSCPAWQTPIDMQFSEAGMTAASSVTRVSVGWPDISAVQADERNYYLFAGPGAVWPVPKSAMSDAECAIVDGQIAARSAAARS